MSRPWRIIILLITLAITAGAFAARVSVLGNSLAATSIAQVNTVCAPPLGAGELCSRCYASFCKTLPARAPALCSSFCSTSVNMAAPSAPAPITIPTPPTVITPPSAIYAPSSANTIRVLSSRSTAPVCGNTICEPTEAQYCPRDCPGTSSARNSSVSSFHNPLGLSCTPLPAGTDGCSACLRALCPLYTEGQAIGYCQATCNSILGATSKSSARTTPVSSQQSSMRQPSGSYIEITTSNAQMFEVAGEGWVSYGISRIHKNTIAPNGAQATASWEAQLPFAQYALYMYWPQNRETAEAQLMDTVPMSLNLNSTNFSFTVNQRNAPPAFSQTIGGYGPETAIHNWYYLGTFNPLAQNGYEQAQTLRLFLTTGRASDAVKKASDGWVAAGDLRIYYTPFAPQCGDGKCHESEKTTCPVDCAGTPQCGNGYCDVRLGETLKTCTTDCGGSGICGNLRCEGFNNENPGSCPTDCQYGGTTGGTTGTTGGTTGGGASSTIRSSAASLSSAFGNTKCGDGLCSKDAGENTDNCPVDCKTQGAQCGNGLCEYEQGENTTNCSKDCGGGAACGNGICEQDRNETSANCPKDCGTPPSSRASSRASSKATSTASVKSTNSSTASSVKPINKCGDGICTQDEKDAFRFAMEGGLLCVVDCPGILKAGCSLTDKFGSTCTDSDCGVQPYIVGNVTYSNNTGAGPLKDFCIGTSAVAETACVTDPYKNNALALQFFYNIDCPYGCVNGACKQNPSGQTQATSIAPAYVPPLTTPIKVAPPTAPIETTAPSVQQPSPIIKAAPPASSAPSLLAPPAAVTCANQTNGSESCRSCLRWVCALLPNGQAESYCAKYCTQNSATLPTPAVAAAPATTSVANKIFRVTDFGANLGDTLPDDRAFSQCLQGAINASGTCSIGAGQLTLSLSPAELRSINGTHIDAKNMIIEGMNNSTIIKGTSAKGFDVLQLNRVSNLTIRNLAITAEKTSPDMTQGVNGISLTNGTANITIDGVSVYDLPYVMKEDFIDGGKAFTVQTGKDPSTSSTNIKIQNSRSTRNPTGFSLDSNPNNSILPGNIVLQNNTFEEGAFGISVSFATKTAGGTDVPGFAMDITGNTLTNIRHPLVIGRAPNVRFVSNTISTIDNPVIPDPSAYTFSQYPFVLLGLVNHSFQKNIITYENGPGSLFIIGGTPNAAYSDNLVFSGNTIESSERTGVKMQNAGGIAIRNSVFGCNTIKKILQPFYDPLLAEFVYQNTVTTACNGQASLTPSRGWWASLTNFTASLFKKY